MKKTIILVTLLATLLGCGCDKLGSQIKPSASPAIIDSQKVGRFQIVQFERTSSNGSKTPTVFRIDSTTGETWTLDLQGDTAKWISISDNLQTIIYHDKQGQRTDAVTKTVDGRDVNDLSREELIRLLTAPSSTKSTIDANGVISTPDGLKWRREGDILVPADRPSNDPLGIRNDPFIKPGGALEKLLKESQKQDSQKK